VATCAAGGVTPAVIRKAARRARRSYGCAPDEKATMTMNDDSKDQLTKILGAYDDTLAEVARVDAANLAAQVAFPARYAALRRDTIRPTIQEFADVLSGRGHEVTVRELEESTSSDVGVTFAAIVLRVVPKAFANNGPETKKSFIEVSFSANRLERKVVVASTNTIINSSGSVGKRGAYDVDALTPTIVEAHVLHALREGLTVRGASP